ncbi:hypothetical protein GPECTOR_74g712 [Gonium pectorale]|uniref:Thioredoxin domain-containing protein n=1 Tax=Gonium pectorale TaxID=33097 RepID=A0A150G2N0_GONPE|nr:hypothetical protein GPECTOR_74g712 [Gonium pectorale]|eukprot:KXZ44098.1 hypothetical protein GPECTOR_74g712 [Gonium pectorale]
MALESVAVLSVQPQPKDKPSMIASHMAGLRTDKEFYDYLTEHKAHTHTQLKFAVAQVDTLKDAVKGVKYSPTFHFYRNGRVVDRVLGKEPQRLADHLWLHSD